MRVLCLSPYLPPPSGGIEKEMLSVAGELQALGHEVTLLATTARFPAGENPAPPAVPAGLAVRRLRGHLRSTLRGFAPARAPLRVPGLRDAALDASPDLVLVFNAGWAPPLRPVLDALRGRAPVLYRTYFHPPGGIFRKLKTRYILRTVARADRAFVATRKEAHELAATGHLTAAGIAVIPPGVHVYPDNPAAVEAVRRELRLEGKTVVAHTARLSAFKGTGDLVETLADVRKATGEDVVLLLLGPGGEPYAERARALGVAEHVRFAGEVTDDRRLRAMLRAAHVFALPSEYEAYGIAYIEALAEGVPCIGCDVGGVAEALGEGGVLLPAFGDRRALRDAIAGLVGDPDRRRAMGEGGRKRVLSSLTWRHTADRLLALGALVAGLRHGAALEGAHGGAIGGART